MRIRNLVWAATLAAATASTASAEPVDPSNDLDCAIIFKFFHLVAEDRHAPADELQLTSIMNAWFADEWERTHPGKDEKYVEHYRAVATALGDDPNGHREMIRTCSNRAFSDPAFEPFWILHNKAAPTAH